MTTRIKLRRDTAANWLTANPILAAGEPALETDTGKVKYGDGVTAYSQLSHAGGDTLNDAGGVVVTAGSTKYWVAAQRREGKDIYGRGVRYDSLGNSYTLTQTSDDSDTLAVITKYSPTGTLLWQHSIDQAEPCALAVDSSNSVYVTAEGQGDNSNLVHLIKFADDGEVSWKKTYDAGNWQGEAFIEERTSTRLVMTMNRQNESTYQVLVLDINTATGDIVTERILSKDTDMYASGIDTDGSGNVFVTGRYFDANDGKDKMFVEKLDTGLERVWSKSLETDTTYSMSGGDCASDAQGNVYAVGYYDVRTTNPDGTDEETAGVLIKLNSSGVVQWTRRLGPGPCGQSVVGLTATATGEVYLVTSTLEFDRSNKQFNDFEHMANGVARMIVAKYDTAGAVIWQRYLDAVHVWEENDTFRGQTIAVYDDKFIVDFYGRSWNTTPFNFAGSDDEEADYFLLQLPTDGTELTIGEVEFRSSRIPGRFVTHETTTSPTTNEAYEGTIVTTSSLELDPVSRVANALVKSQTYDYLFGPDGTLTIPNDGDIKLTQNQTGFFSVIGPTINYDDDTWGRAITADSEGNTYVVGEDDDSNQPIVVKIGPQGHRLWTVSIEDDINGNGGRANGIALHPTNGNVYVVCEMYGNYTYGLLVVIDQDTGRVLDSTDYTDTSNDVYLNDIAFQSDNSFVIGGSKNGEFSPEQTVTKQNGSTTSTLILLRSEVDGAPTNNWQIGGTGFSVFENLQSVEYYTAVTTTVREGSGAVFDIADNGDGTYYASGVQNAGTNYRAGHKIKVLGTALGGATPANDCIVTVGSIAGEGGVFQWSVAGTAAGSVFNVYGAVTGTNIDVGTGATFNYQKDPNNSDYSSYYNFNVNTQGSNYADGDVLTISGDQLGGTSPANDLVFTVYTGQAGLASVSSPNNPTGTAQTTTWKLVTNTAVDFSQEGSWQLTFPLSRENLLIGDGFKRVYGTNTGDQTDRTYAIAVDSSDNIITATQGYGVVTGQSTNTLAVVYKFNSTGTLQWARKLNEVDSGAEAKSVVTIGTDIYVTHYSYSDGETVITKLDADGNVKWQKRVNSSSDSSIAAASDGTLVIVAEAYNDDIGDDAIKLFKLTTNGETVYKRWLFATTDDDTRFKNGRCLYERDGYIYITSYYEEDYDTWFVARLPLDGSGTGEYSQFRYMDTVPMTNNFFYYNGQSTGTNYLIGEFGDSYAGALTVPAYVDSTVTSINAVGSAIYVNTYYPPYFWEEIVDEDGGNIVFADGTKQNTSATDTPQRLYTGQRYTLSMRDRGHHIYCTDQNDNILIPYDSRVPFPIGTTIVIVNDSGSSVYIGTEGGGTSLMVAGYGSYGGAELYSNGVATLMKVGKEKWVIYGNQLNTW